MIAMAKSDPQKSPLTPEKKRRNLALLAALLLFVAIVYGVTIVRVHLTGAP